MLKKFFISMLGTMAGIWLSLIIICIGVVLMVTNAFTKNSNPHLMSEKILLVSLSGDIADYDPTVDVKSFVSGTEQAEAPLSDIFEALKMACDDDLVKGVFVDCRGASLGMASRQELMEALANFRKSGKWVYAYADNFTQGDYFVASSADKVFLNPVGSLDIHGICANTLYFKDILDNLGVQLDIVKVGDYKSAVEPFTRMDMSEADREQTTIYVSSLWQTMTGLMGQNRDIPASDYNTWADDFAFTLAPEEFVKGKAIDSLCYYSEVEDILREKMSLSKDKELPFVGVREYMDFSVMDKPSKGRDHVAVLYAVGDITENDKTGIASERLVPEIIALASDEHVKGLVLRVNSGGGSAFASEQIWKALEDFKGTGKPFYVSMGDVAASGGYYISCGADRIYADETTITGSIGIFGIIPNARKLLADKIHLGIDSVSTNANAAFPSLYYPLTETQKQKMQAYVERGYDTFVSRVSAGRDLPADSVKAIGGGRVWDGVSAHEIGLVDEFGSLDNVICDITEKLGMKPTDYINYPEIELSLVDILSQNVASGISIDIEGLPAEEVRNLYEVYSRLKNINPMQARMNKVIIE